MAGTCIKIMRMSFFSVFFLAITSNSSPSPLVVPTRGFSQASRSFSRALHEFHSCQTKIFTKDAAIIRRSPILNLQFATIKQGKKCSIHTKILHPPEPFLGNTILQINTIAYLVSTSHDQDLNTKKKFKLTKNF